MRKNKELPSSDILTKPRLNPFSINKSRRTKKFPDIYIRVGGPNSETRFVKAHIKSESNKRGNKEYRRLQWREANHVQTFYMGSLVSKGSIL